MDNKKSTFTVLQLARMGDLVQTYQACLDFKGQHPDIRLVLVARQSFAEPLRFLLDTVFDDIIMIAPDIVLGSSSNSLSGLLKASKKVIDDINEKDSDVLINFSFCQVSNYLSSAVEAKHRLGTFINNDNFVTVHDQWSQVIHTMTQRGAYCPYNLVDLFKNILGIKPQVTNPASTVAKKESILAIHPFSSHPKKNWDMKKWIEIIYSFLKNNPSYKVYLFGSKNEVELTAKLKQEPILQRFSNRIYSLVGKLSLEESYQKLSTCSYFIGHDSLLGHLAKVAQIPTLTVSLGTVREIETAPYGDHSYILSPKTNCYPCFPDTPCDYYKCHSDISYQAVSSLLDHFVQKGKITEEDIAKRVSPFHINSLNVFREDFSQSGWIYLSELTGNSANIRDIIKTFLRVSLSFKMEEIEEVFPVPKLTPQTYRRLLEVNDGIRQLFELCEFGKKYSRYILQELSKDNPSVALIKEHSQKIEEIDSLMDLVRRTYIELAPVIDYYKVTKSNLIGSSLVEITESSYLVYNDNGSLCSLLFELTESTIKRNNHLAPHKNNLVKKGEV